MPITLTVDRPDELPEPIRAAAKEADGKFVVEKLPDGWGLDLVAASRGKLTKAEQDLRRAQERLKAFAKDEQGTLYEPDEFRELVTDYGRLKEAQGKAPNIDDLRRQIVAEAENKWSKKYGEAEKAREQLDRELDRTTLEATIGQLVAELGPKEGKAEVVKLLLREKLGIEKKEGKRVVRVRNGDDWMPGGDQDGYMSPKDWALNSLRVQQADMFRGDGESGAGVSQSKGGSRSRFTFPRSKLNGGVAEFNALRAKAKAAGAEVELIDD